MDTKIRGDGDRQEIIIKKPYTVRSPIKAKLLYPKF